MHDFTALGHFGINLRMIWDHGCIKDQQPYPNQDQDAKPQSGTSSVLQSPKSGLKGNRCSLHLQNPP